MTLTATRAVCVCYFYVLVVARTGVCSSHSSVAPISSFSSCRTWTYTEALAKAPTCLPALMQSVMRGSAGLLISINILQYRDGAQAAC